MSTTLQALVVDPRRPNSSGPRTITDDLTTLQGLVGGYLQAVYGFRTPDQTLQAWPRVTIYLNEEGKIHGLPLNPLATALWWHFDPQAIGGDILVGPVVILGGGDDNDDNTGVPGDVLEVYTALRDGSYPLTYRLTRA